MLMLMMMLRGNAGIGSCCSLWVTLDAIGEAALVTSMLSMLSMLSIQVGIATASISTKE